MVASARAYTYELPFSNRPESHTEGYNVSRLCAALCRTSEPTHFRGGRATSACLSSSPPRENPLNSRAFLPPLVVYVQCTVKYVRSLRNETTRDDARPERSSRALSSVNCSPRFG